MSGTDGIERFSERVDDYVRYRPDYPDAVATWLHDEHGVSSEARVADIGAGTGISTRYWRARGHRVWAVEPNDEMRAAIAGEGDGDGITVVDGTAEATTLADASIDLIACATAFHWFDPAPTRAEWARILAPGGLACVFWNSRMPEASEFLRGYEDLLHRYGRDYASTVRRKPDDDAMRAWFGAGFRGAARFPHAQWLDFDALLGRMRSSSSAPTPGDANYAPMVDALHTLFDACSEQGRVRFDYLTRVFVGTLP